MIQADERWREHQNRIYDNWHEPTTFDAAFCFRGLDMSFDQFEGLFDINAILNQIIGRIKDQIRRACDMTLIRLSPLSAAAQATRACNDSLGSDDYLAIIRKYDPNYLRELFGGPNFSYCTQQQRIDQWMQRNPGSIIRDP